MSTLAQFLVLRADLALALEWPVGAVIAQGAHAATAAIAANLANTSVQQYIARDNIPVMRKVVKQVRDEKALLKLSKQLEDLEVAHFLWREQPEDIVTALATVPIDSAQVPKPLKKLNLFKDPLPREKSTDSTAVADGKRIDSANAQGLEVSSLDHKEGGEE